MILGIENTLIYYNIYKKISALGGSFFVCAKFAKIRGGVNLQNILKDLNDIICLKLH